MTASERGTHQSLAGGRLAQEGGGTPEPSPCSSTNPAGWLPYLRAIFLLLLRWVLIVGALGRIDRQRRWLRVTTYVMIGFITVTTALTAAGLGQSIFAHACCASAAETFTTGARVWPTKVITFALWF